jgi:hypothetical protein
MRWPRPSAVRGCSTGCVYDTLEAATRVAHAPATTYSDETVANRDVRDFGWGIVHAAVTRRPTISLYTMIPRTGGYVYDVGGLGFVCHSRAIFCRAVPNLSGTIRNFSIAVWH